MQQVEGYQLLCYNLNLCRPSLSAKKATQSYFDCTLKLKLPIRCRPLTVTGPVPAFSLMVTGALSSNSPRLTYRGDQIIYVHREEGGGTHGNWHCHRWRPQVPLAGSWREGWRWAPRWFFLGGSWLSPPPRCSPPWHPLPGKPGGNKPQRLKNWCIHWGLRGEGEKKNPRHVVTSVTYCPELQEMLQFIILILLESVERQFGRQLAACGTEWRRTLNRRNMTREMAGDKRSLIVFHVVAGGEPTCAPGRRNRFKSRNVSYWTGSSPASSGRTRREPRSRRRCR